MDIGLLINTNGTCTVPSQSGPQSYHVNLSNYTCECKASLSGNVCKHIHFANMILLARGVSLFEIRQQLSKQIVEERSYLLDRGSLTVFLERGSISVISLENGYCSCNTSSFGQMCVCHHVHSLLTEEQTVCELTSEIETEPPNIPLTTAPTTAKNTNTQTMLAELHQWSTSSEYTETSEFHNTRKGLHNSLWYISILLISQKNQTSTSI